MIFFRIRTDCPVETMLRRTRLISDRTSDKALFLKKIKTTRACVALKTIYEATVL